jgi:iron complex outermembrane receptor protein
MNASPETCQSSLSTTYSGGLMGKKFFVFLFFISEMAFAEKIIPPVIVIPEHSFTSGPMKVITHEQIEMSGTTTVSQLLQKTSGLQLRNTTGNPNQPSISIRGFGANADSNTLVLIDGVPIVNPDLMPTDLSSIALQNVDHIEIVSGSEGVLYGDEAVGGIINIISQEKVKKEVSCSLGSYDQKNCSVSLQNRYKKLFYGIYLQKNHTNNYREHNDYDQNQLSGNLNYEYSSGKLKFNFNTANEKTLYPGALTSAQVSQNRRQANNNTDYFRDWNGFYHLRDEQVINSNWTLDTDLSRREMHGDGVLFSPFTQYRVTHFLKPQLKGVTGNLISFYGFDIQDDQYSLSSSFGTTRDSQQKYGVFLLYNYAMNDKLTFSAGARVAQQNNHLSSQSSLSNQNNQASATTIGLTYQYNPDTKFFIRRAGSFRFPKADENASTLSGQGLKTQQGVSYEAGIIQHYKKFTTKFSVYQLNLTHEIAFDPLQTPQDPLGTNRNLDPTSRSGFSLGEKYQVTDEFLLHGEYNYVNARFQSGPNKGNRIPLVAENLFNLGALYDFNDHWSSDVEAAYTGNQFPDNDDRNAAGKNGGYTVYNLNVQYHRDKLSAVFSFNNIFNKYYYDYTVYQSSMNSEFYYPAAGRNVLLTVNYSI